jgi:hypothetical protein
MRKGLFFGLILLNLSTSGYSQSRFYVAPWVQKIFLGFNMLYDYEQFSDGDFVIKTNNMLFEFALGYDFGRIVPRVFFDIGLPLHGTVGFTDGAESLTDVMDTENFKFGLEAGFKPIKTSRIDVTIPLGILFCWTSYLQKNPSYTWGWNPVPYDRTWDYNYINLFSGVDVLFRLNDHFKIGLFSRMGVPIKKEYEYKEKLRGNYYWTDTGTNVYSYKPSNVDIFTLSVGIGVLANL